MFVLLPSTSRAFAFSLIDLALATSVSQSSHQVAEGAKTHANR